MARNGVKTGGGSRKGAPNKATAELKQMILNALDKAGGEEYLAKQAIATPAAFMALIGRVLPMQVSGEGGGPVSVELLTTFRLPVNDR